MIDASKKLCIIGNGGFGREVLCCFIDSLPKPVENLRSKVCFMVEDRYMEQPETMGIEVIPFSKFDANQYNVVIGIGDPTVRKAIVDKLPSNTAYTSIIHPTALISNWVAIEEGAVICAGSILTCNIKIGKHAHINLNTTIGHDCSIGEFFTTGPATNISGNCKFGDCVYIGTNVSVKQSVSICDNTTIGMGAVVVKNISDSGIYIGNPLRRLESK